MVHTIWRLRGLQVRCRSSMERRCCGDYICKYNSSSTHLHVSIQTVANAVRPRKILLLVAEKASTHDLHKVRHNSNTPRMRQRKNQQSVVNYMRLPCPASVPPCRPRLRWILRCWVLCRQSQARHGYLGAAGELHAGIVEL